MRVFIGDPCYVMTRDDYFTMLSLRGWEDDCDDGTSCVPNCFFDGEDEEDVCEWNRDEYWENTYSPLYPVGPNGDPLRVVKVTDTWVGDGVYGDEEGREYCVDSGQIGIVPEIMWNKDKTDEELNRLGHIVDDYDFTNNWFVEHLNGTLHCGPVSIMTGPGDFNGVYQDDED